MELPYHTDHVRVILLSGPGATGKSTLAKTLVQMIHERGLGIAQVVPTSSRQTMIDYGVKNEGEANALPYEKLKELQHLIIDNSVETLERYWWAAVCGSQKQKRWLISDRSSLDHIAYHDYRVELPRMRAAFKEADRTRDYTNAPTSAEFVHSELDRTLKSGLTIRQFFAYLRGTGSLQIRQMPWPTPWPFKPDDGFRVTSERENSDLSMLMHSVHLLADFRPGNDNYFSLPQDPTLWPESIIAAAR